MTKSKKQTDDPGQDQLAAEPPGAQQGPGPSDPAEIMERLKAAGFDPNQVIEAISPMVETAVVKTLERLHLAEAIDKRMQDIEARLSQQQAAPAPGSGAESDNNAQLRDGLMAAVIQKFLGGNSGGTGELEKMSSYLAATKQIADTFYAPLHEAEDRAQKRLVGQLELYRKAGATAEKATDLVIEDAQRE